MVLLLLIKISVYSYQYKTTYTYAYYYLKRIYIVSDVKKNPNVADLQMLASNYINFTDE